MAVVSTPPPPPVLDQTSNINLYPLCCLPLRSKQDGTYFYNIDLAIPEAASSADLSVAPPPGSSAATFSCGERGSGPTQTPGNELTGEDTVASDGTISGASVTGAPNGVVVGTALAALVGMIVVPAAAGDF